MNIRKLLFVAMSFAIIFTSCSKEESLKVVDNPPNEILDKLKGTYDFLGASLKGKSTVTAVFNEQLETAITYNEYVTKSSSGTYVFDAGKITGTQIVYSVDTVFKYEYYVGNVLEISEDIPFKYTVPVLNSVAPYQLVGTDSLHLESGLFSLPSDNTNSIPTQESYTRFTFSGDTLFLYSDFNLEKTQTDGGVSMKTVTIGRSTTILKRKK